MSNTLGQARRILEIVDEQDACRAQLQTLIDGGHLVHLVKAAKESRLPPLDAFVAFLNGGVAPVATAPAASAPTAPPATPIGEIWHLTVDGRSLEEMKTAGGYNWTNSDITEKRFPITVDQTGELEARYFWFDEDIESPEAKRRIKAEDPANPWQAAQTGHLLAHGERHPEEQRKFPIIGLGSVAGVFFFRFVPFLFGDGTNRYLSLRWWYDRWLRDCRFLAVRRVSAPQVVADAAPAPQRLGAWAF